MRVGLSLTLSGAFAAQAFAADVAVMVGIPRLSVAEYHKPYVAIWLERPDQMGNIAVWYDFSSRTMKAPNGSRTFGSGGAAAAVS